jgi:membrane protease subunit HflK
VRLPKILTGVVVLILLLSGLFSSFYTVPAESQAVVLRFGKPNKTSKPGLHF